MKKIWLPALISLAGILTLVACEEKDNPLNPAESGNSIMNDAQNAVNAEEAQGLITTIVSVDGMTCGKCVNKITSELNKLEGVFNVIVDLNEKNATVEHDSSVSVDDIKEGIMAVGYTPAD